MNDKVKAIVERSWKAIRSSCDDLREMGLSVAVHNDYRQDGKRRTFWLMTKPLDMDGRHPIIRSFIGEGDSDEEALDKIRASYAEATDKLHHAPMCPANHYCGMRPPTGKCNCGATEIDVE